MTDRSDALVLTYRTPRGQDFRTVVEPRADGAFDVVEETRDIGGAWREVGHDEAVDVVVGGTVADASL